MTSSFSIRGSAALAALALLVGCVVSTEEAVPVERAAQSVFGTVSTEHPELGWFIHEEQSAATATLVAPRLAVVSLHSVARFLGGNATGGVSTADSLCPELSEYDDKAGFLIKFPAGDRKVDRLITNGQRTLCDGDIAFLVLNEPVDVPMVPLRLDRGSVVGEATRVCGLGNFDVQCSHDQKTVHCSDGTVELPNGGYFAPASQDVAATFMVSTNRICVGDSGSPMFSTATGAMIGTVSASIGDPTVVNTISEPCKACSSGSALTTLFSAQPEYVARAFAAVGLAPWREGHDKPVDLGAACTEPLDCNSQLCVGLGDGSVCSQYCSAERACQEGFTCTAAGAQSVCLPSVDPQPEACAVQAPFGRTTGPSWILATLAGLLVLGRRARSKAGAR